MTPTVAYSGWKFGKVSNTSCSEISITNKPTFGKQDNIMIMILMTRTPNDAGTLETHINLRESKIKAISYSTCWYPIVTKVVIYYLYYVLQVALAYNLRDASLHCSPFVLTQINPWFRFQFRSLSTSLRIAVHRRLNNRELYSVTWTTSFKLNVRRHCPIFWYR